MDRSEDVVRLLVGEKALPFVVRLGEGHGLARILSLPETPDAGLVECLAHDAEDVSD